MSESQTWVAPTIITAVVFYLCLEALVTRNVAFPIFSEAVALIAMDAVAPPWRTASTTWTAIAVPEEILDARQRTLAARS